MMMLQEQLQNLKELLSNFSLPILIGLLALLAVQHYWNVYSLWPRLGFKGDQPLVPFLGELWDLLFNSQMGLAIERRNKYGKIYGYFFMGRQRVVVSDPGIIRQIAIKDFDLFPNHQINPFSNKYQWNNLVWLQDEQWKRTRSLMTPTFTSGKIKRMFVLLDGCADDLVENLKEKYIRARRNGETCAEVNLQDTFSMYTMDGITTCCYGIKLKRQQFKQNSTEHGKHLKHKPNHASRDSFVRDLNVLAKNRLDRMLTLIFVPKFILKLVGFSLINEQDCKPVVDRVQKMIDLRRDNKENTKKYDDLLQLLIEAKADDKVELNEQDLAENHHAGLTKDSIEEDQNKLYKSIQKSLQQTTSTTTNKTKLSDFEILCEAMLLLSAGLDTTRSSLSTICYFLAHHQQVQERLVLELKSIAQYTPTALGKHLSFDYDSLTSCQYLDAVISESLRMFPPAIFTDRVATQDYPIEKYNVIVPKGMQVLFGIYAVHMDPDYWEQPDQFDPDRFMPGRKENIVPGSYAPFSLGPRHCIGMRFSLTETKLGLAKVLMNFKLEPAPNTEYPPQPSRSSFLMNIRNCKVKVLLRDLD